MKVVGFRISQYQWLKYYHPRVSYSFLHNLSLSTRIILFLLLLDTTLKYQLERDFSTPSVLPRALLLPKF